MAHISLPYNAILGYPALAKFMAITHHAYNMVKLPGRDGIITIRGEVEDAVRSVERAFKVLVASHPSDEDDDGHLVEVPKKKLLFSPEAAAMKTPPMSTAARGLAPPTTQLLFPIRGEYIVAGSPNRAPPQGHGETQPKRVVKDAIF